MGRSDHLSGSSIDHKYEARAEVNNSYKRVRLSHQSKHYRSIKFYSVGQQAHHLNAKLDSVQLTSITCLHALEFSVHLHVRF
jgi:hypothetical protein